MQASADFFQGFRCCDSVWSMTVLHVYLNGGSLLVEVVSSTGFTAST